MVDDVTRQGGDGVGGAECADVRGRLAQIEDAVMKGLTPFQRATVKHVAQLYRGDGRGAGRQRALVADEVGLGKTLIARGVLAEIAMLRAEEGDPLVKVAYICSNAAIALQNVRKLKIDGDIKMESPDDSRLSMQHLKVASERGDEALARRYIQITPITPGTSFNISSGDGTMSERALMLAVLAYDERLGRDSGRFERLSELLWSKRSNSNPRSWRDRCERAAAKVREARANDPGRGERSGYPYDVLDGLWRELDAAGSTTADSLCDYLDAGERDSSRERVIINDLRRAFANVCVSMLDVDFVIMDEFQRYQDLLSEKDSETSILVQRFLQGETRVLLLSATPFRLYSTEAELDTGELGDSYKEFLEVMDFLAGDDAAEHDRVKRVWGVYVSKMRLLTAGACGIDEVIAARAAAEEVARGLMVRTERQSTGELGPIADITTHGARSGEGRLARPPAIAITPNDIRAYVRMRALARKADPDRGLMSVDYVKSCPFPLSFMSDYKLFKQLVKKAEEHPELISADKSADGGLLWLRSWDVSSYKRIKVRHARFQALLADVKGTDDVASIHPERLLWVPASRPYYRPSADSPYAHAAGFSKMVLFSSWAMVPPAVSCLLSYEFERANVLRLSRSSGKEFRYFKGEGDVDETRDSQALPSHRMRFDREQHNAFLLVYPSRYLEGLIDVNRIASDSLSLAELRRSLRARITADLARVLGVERLPRGLAGPRGSIDWYVMAALMLDRAAGHDVLGELLDGDGRKALALTGAYATEGEVLEDIRGMAARWDARDFSRFPGDIANVLADAAIASPAVCSLRSYGAFAGGADSVPAWMAFQFGHAFARRMNTASATLAVAASMERRDEASSHWKNLLDYSCEGNLQAVLDEYAFLQWDGDAKVDDPDALVRFHEAMVGPGDRPDLRNVETVHEVRVPNYASNKAERVGKIRMRTNIASAYMDIKRSGDKAGQSILRSTLREAFNSPFRPFFLTSTSVGQEGLDFHFYCRKICHWNLPSNPVDLEQREGRVNRYQGLAVRQGIAARYGDMRFDTPPLSEGHSVNPDANRKPLPIWRQLFAAAEKNETEREGRASGSGLLPNWGLTKHGASVPIERYVYPYPFSRDEALYDSLMEQVLRYRIVIGQPNQEELLRLLEELVAQGLIGESQRERLYINLCPFVWRSEG